jgi:hypothetical protein
MKRNTSNPGKVGGKAGAKKKSPRSPKNKKEDRGTSAGDVLKKSVTSIGNFPKVRQQLLTVMEFVKTIRRSTDLCHRIDWALLTPD